MKRKVTVLGAGNGAQTLAGDLASRGHEVTLYEHPDFADKIRDINLKGNKILLTNTLEKEGQLAQATTDIAVAMKGAEIIFFVAPTFAQTPIFKLAVPYFEAGQTLVIIPGNFGSFALRKILRESNGPDIYIAETDTLPYACRLIENGKINVWGIKQYVRIGTLPGKDYPVVEKILRDVFPVEIRELPNSMAAGLANTNMVVHCATMIMNAGRIESEKGNFRFYTDGMSPSVCKVQEAIDRERMAVAESLGIPLISALDGLKTMYNLQGETLHEALAENPAYGAHGPDAPKTMTHRYLSEDIPYLLVPVSMLGRITNVPTPVTDSIILLSETVNDAKYSDVGWNAEQLGIQGMSRNELIEFIR
ncbi:MAG TPA: NAD/NADP octopine/nopaline dehydrogenase [Synergistaceae bacterium]|jgi:opine dehydrogenase|nr:NAD/NADP octopine/nopaline dehydrogenase [Synergistaceae bacterium]